MCHGYEFSRDRLKDEIARELLEEMDEHPDREDGAPADAGGTPSFLNEERDTDVDILTDGGSEE